MINITVKTLSGSKLNQSSVSCVMHGDKKELIHELCTFFEAIEKTKYCDVLNCAIDIFITEKLKELEGDEE